MQVAETAFLRGAIAALGLVLLTPLSPARAQIAAPNPPLVLVPHRAIYDLTLGEVRGNSPIAGVTGRILYTPCTPSASGLHTAGLSWVRETGRLGVCSARVARRCPRFALGRPAIIRPKGRPVAGNGRLEGRRRDRRAPPLPAGAARHTVPASHSHHSGSTLPPRRRASA